MFEPDTSAPSSQTSRSAVDRRKSIEWSRALLAAPSEWVVLDTETTGLGLTDEVIQIAVVAPDGSVLLDSLVRPVSRGDIPASASAIHHITIDMLAGAPTFARLAPRLAQVLGSRRIVAYNAEYDRRLLKQTALMSGGHAPQAQWECAMLAYSRFVGEWDSRKNDYRFQRLPSGDHSAAGDCRATLKLIELMAHASG
jgi:DNA polymerase III epsilon subunit-like protein